MYYVCTTSICLIVNAFWQTGVIMKMTIRLKEGKQYYGKMKDDINTDPEYGLISN